QRESRLAMCACLNADMIFCGVKDGRCYFEVYFTDDPDGPSAILSLPTEGLTAEKISNHAAEADRKRREAEGNQGQSKQRFQRPPIPNRSSGGVLTAATQLYGQGCRKLCSTPAVTIVPPSLRGMSSALRVASGTRRSVFTGTHIAWIASCTTPSTTVDTAGHAWSI